MFQWRHAFCLAAMLAATPALAQEMQSRIEVTGEGRIMAVPDMATLRLGVEARAADPGAAVDAMSRQMAPVMEALTGAGIAERDIQTGQLTLRPIYPEPRPVDGTPEGPEIEGYVAVTQVIVKVRDLDGLGALLSDAVGTGANRFEGIAFELSDPDAAQDQALEAAVSDAAGKAALLAQAAGRTLGPLREMVEQGGSRPMPMMMEAASSRMADVPIAPGEIEAVASVRMVYNLDP